MSFCNERFRAGPQTTRNFSTMYRLSIACNAMMDVRTYHCLHVINVINCAVQKSSLSTRVLSSNLFYHIYVVEHFIDIFLHFLILEDEDLYLH